MTTNLDMTDHFFCPWQMQAVTPMVLSMCIDCIKVLIWLFSYVLTPPQLRFFITFVATPHLDGMHVVFGEVADDESKAIIKKIESKSQQRNTGKIFIEKAGELPQ